ADATAERAAAARPVLHVRLDVALAAARQRLRRALLAALHRPARGAVRSAGPQVGRRAHRSRRAARPRAREAVRARRLRAAHRRHRGEPDVPPRNGVGGSPGGGARLCFPARVREGGRTLTPNSQLPTPKALPTPMPDLACKAAGSLARSAVGDWEFVGSWELGVGNWELGVCV